MLQRQTLGPVEGTPPDRMLQWARFSVDYAYPVAFTQGLFAPSNPLLVETLEARGERRRHRCLFVLDAGLVAADPGLPSRIAAYAAAHAGRMALAAPPVVVAGGEAVKTDPDQWHPIRAAIVAAGLDRHSYLVAVGGGALLDAAGYAAATAHRGIRHIRVPTTTLAQNDSGVGVKNAVNHAGMKNYLGTFAPPFAVLNDFGFLDLLPARDRRAGLAEAVKVALIRDGDFFLWLERQAAALARFAPEAEQEMIRRCAALHLRQITQGGDPFELGSARPLDFGHWAAHKLEILTGHALRHGEAVAIGLALDSRYSVSAGRLAPGGEARVAALLERLGFTLYHPALRAGDALIAGLREFQEHLGGELTITLLEGLGRGVEVHDIDPRLVAEAIDWLEARQA